MGIAVKNPISRQEKGQVRIGNPGFKDGQKTERIFGQYYRKKDSV